MRVNHKIKIRRAPEYAVALKALREQRGAKQTTIAKRLGISSMGLSHWETGERPMRVTQLEAWANTLCMEIVITISPLTTNQKDSL